MPDDRTEGALPTADALSARRAPGRSGEHRDLPGVPEAGVRAVFAQLEGEWALRRTISLAGQKRHDHGFAAPPEANVHISLAGTMLGRAIFTPLRPGVLHYREDGRLELASGHIGDAYREYYYLLEGDHIHVTFADAPPGERTFLRLRPRPVAGAAEGGSWAHDTHYCGRDTYTGTYNFESAARLVVTISVRGPEKDYVIRTALTR